MSAVDELVKLTELKEKGAITSEEFEKQKSMLLAGKTTKKGGLWWRIPVGVVGGLLFIATIYGAYNKGAVSDTLPLCDSKEAKDTLKAAFDSNPSSQTYHYSMIDIDKISEVKYTKGVNRVCKAHTQLNSGDKLNFGYTLTSKADGTFLLNYYPDLTDGNEAKPVAELKSKGNEAKVEDEIMPNAINSKSTTGNPDGTTSEQDPAVDACVQAKTDETRKTIGPDEPINFDVINEWTEQCKAAKKVK